MIGRHPIIGPRTRSLILRGSTCSPDCPKQAIAECLTVSARGPARRQKGLRPTRSPASVPRDLPSSASIPRGPWQPAPVGGIIFGMQRLFVEPDVLHAIAVVNAVDHGQLLAFFAVGARPIAGRSACQPPDCYPPGATCTQPYVKGLVTDQDHRRLAIAIV